MKLILLSVTLIALSDSISCRRPAHRVRDERERENDIFAFDRVTISPLEVESTATTAPEIRPLFSQEFLEEYVKFAETCAKIGCTVCSQNPSTGRDDCKQVSPMTRFPNPFLSLLTRMKMKGHGFLEYQIEIQSMRAEDKTFRVKLMEIAEAIKKVMIAKDGIESCVPQLVQHEPALSSAQVPMSLPILSQGFMESLSTFVKQVLLRGGNLCLGEADAINGKNCMRIDWNPVCHNYNSDLPTITIKRMRDEVILTLSPRVPNTSEEITLPELDPDRSFRLEASTLTEVKQGMEAVRPHVRATGHDPLTVEQLFEVANNMIDFMSEHAFRA